MISGTILFNSITLSIRAQKLLDGQGLKSNIRKISKTGSTKGCSYGLDVQGDLNRALRILDSAGIRYIDVVMA